MARVCFACEPLSRRTLLAAGALDTSFSGDGIASAVPGLEVEDIGVQSTGKVIVAGHSTSAALAGKFVLARYNVDGSRDLTFGSGGFAVASFDAFTPNRATLRSIVVTPDDRIVAGGSGSMGNFAYAYITRFSSEGALDPTFSSDGILQFDSYDGASLSASVSDVSLQSDGKVLVTGYGIPNRPEQNALFGVARINTNGTFDNSFDSNGHRYISFVDYESDLPSKVTVDYSGTAGTNPNYGKILVVGTEFKANGSGTRIAIARLSSGGTLDNSFDSDGRVLMNFSSSYAFSNGTTLLPQDGKYVIGSISRTAGSAPQNQGVLRLNANGSLDTTFASGGRIDLGLGVVSELLTSQSGRLLVFGSQGLGTIAVTSLNSDGSLDTNWGTSGVKSIVVPGGTSFRGATLAPGGKIAIANYYNGGAVRLFDRRAATISIGSFEPNASETGPDVASFIVGRVERLPVTTRVYISIGGTARPPAVIPIAPDYTGTNISFGNGLTSSTYVDIPPNETFVVVTITPIDDTRIEGDEYAIFAVGANVEYDIGFPPSATLSIRDNDFLGAPAVNTGSFVYQTAPHQLVFTFNQNVETSITDSDIILTGPPNMPTHAYVYDAVANRATLTFSSLLPDGDYSARIGAASVNNANGTPMAADYVLPFFVLAGDANRDRSVNFDDLLIVAQNYGTVGRNFGQGNFSYDPQGVIDFDDLLILAQQYGTSLAMSVPVVPAAKRRSAIGDVLH